MNISVTSDASTIVRRVREDGRDNLIMVLGTGCCDSTAPYLYDNYLPEPDARPVGEVDGVPIFAPGWLADLYPGDEGLIVDVDSGVVNDSFSLESEFDCRFTLRLPERPLQR
jgi:uncharacterized protein (DUF779 family)